jgi:hypothetical protein
MARRKVWFVFNTDNDNARVNDRDLTSKEQMVEPPIFFLPNKIMISIMKAADFYS